MKKSMAMFSLITSTASAALQKVSHLVSNGNSTNGTSTSDDSAKQERNQWLAFSSTMFLGLTANGLAIKKMINNFSAESLVSAVKNSLTPPRFAAIGSAFTGAALVVSEFLDEDDSIALALGMYALLLSVSDISLYYRAKQVPVDDMQQPLLPVVQGGEEKIHDAQQPVNQGGQQLVIQDMQEEQPQASARVQVLDLDLEAKIEADLAQRLMTTIKIKLPLLYILGIGTYFGLSQPEGQDILKLPALPAALAIPAGLGTFFSAITRYTAVSAPCTPTPAPGH